MSRLFFILLLINILICSCSKDNNKTIDIINKDISVVSDKELIFYDIKNEVLTKEIKMFLDSINNYSYMKKKYSSTFEEEWGWVAPFKFEPKKNKIVEISVTKFENVTFYTLYYPLNPPVSVSTFSRVNNIMVNIFYGYNPDIELPDSIMWKYMKDYFPKEYEFYQKNEDNNMFLASNLSYIST
jgi:hypothetical protein